MIELITEDKEKFEVDSNILSQTGILKRYPKGQQIQLEIHNTENKIVERVIKYLKHHYNNQAKEIEAPLKSCDFKDLVSEWDYDFINVDENIVIHLGVAAHYFEIKGLIQLACTKIASMIMNGKFYPK